MLSRAFPPPPGSHPRSLPCPISRDTWVTVSYFGVHNDAGAWLPDAGEPMKEDLGQHFTPCHMQVGNRWGDVIDEEKVY